MIKGSCLCGEVKYELTGSINEVAVCHCTQCKRAQGTPFATNAPVELAKCKFSNNSDSIKAYFSSPNKKRVFCDNCGTPISFRSQAMSGMMHLYLAALDDPEKFQPTLHVSHEEKLRWYEIGDDLPTHKGPDYTTK